MDRTTIALLKTAVRNRKKYALNRSMTGYSIKEILSPIASRDVKDFNNAIVNNHAMLYPENTVHPFFLTKLLMPLVKKIWTHPDLDLNLLRSVMTSQNITWYNHACINDIIEIHLIIQSIRSTEIGDEITLAATGFRDNQLIIESTTGFIIRNRNQKAKNRELSSASRDEIFRFDLNTRDGQQRDFAEITGDNNLIHTNRFFARIAGLSGTIMHGSLIMAMTCSKITEMLLDNENSRLKSMSAEFVYPAFPGETLKLVGYNTTLKNRVEFDLFNNDSIIILRNGYLEYE